MTLKLFNTLSRKKEEFKPLKGKKVGMYSCGPTVYHYAHIGNLRAYIFNDILRRSLKYLNYELLHVMNITDVGHLTSDADAGEDKMLKGAKREKKSVWEIAQSYTDAFMDDIERLNIEKPDVIPRATDHIKEMIKLIKKIEDNGFAYVAGGNVYFDTSKFKTYSELGRLNIHQLKSGSRVEKDKNKKSPSDFVLWFTKSKFEDQEMKWESPWGMGYPGWHIECSAMSSKYLGEEFDIHTGGIDHIPVHHTNEVAQSEAAFGKHPWVKYWCHNEFLIVDKDKMSKSSGEFLRLQTLIDKGYDPIVYRYFVLGAHYRQQLNFSFKAMDGSQNAYNNLKNKIIELKSNLKFGKTDALTKTKYETKFIDAINDDLNTPISLALVHQVLKDEELSNQDKYELILEFDQILGLKILEMEEEKIEITSDLENLILKRQKAREEKDWATADKIREKLKEKGLVIKDTPDGVKLEKV